MNTVDKPLTRDAVIYYLKDVLAHPRLRAAVEAMYEELDEAKTLLAGVSEVQRNALSEVAKLRAQLDAVYAENEHLTRLVNFNAANAVIAATETSKLIDSLRAELDAARKDAERLRKSIETAKIVMQCARDLSEEIHERGSHELHGRLFSAFCKYDSLFEDRQGPQP